MSRNVVTGLPVGRPVTDLGDEGRRVGLDSKGAHSQRRRPEPSYAGVIREGDVKSINCVYAAALIAGWAAPHAHAELGGAPISLSAADHAAKVRVMRPANRAADGLTTNPAVYIVRESTLESGTVIREYTSGDGIVFGVAWQGPTVPDLASVFGNYLRDYSAGVEAAHASRGWRTPVSVSTRNLVIKTGGHMGAFSGQAWLPPALPSGLTGNDIL